jgi:hypothetical protein
LVKLHRTRIKARAIIHLIVIETKIHYRCLNWMCHIILRFNDLTIMCFRTWFLRATKWVCKWTGSDTSAVKHQGLSQIIYYPKGLEKFRITCSVLV